MKHLDLTTINTAGFHLIEASAGTGKTWTITALYILLLLEDRMRPEEILVVTYTKSATAELRDRIRTRISDTLDLYVTSRPPRDSLEEILLSTRCTAAAAAIQLLTRALYSFDDAAIFTIHGFCQRALTENAFESGSLFDTEMISDQTSILRDVCDDFWRTYVMTAPDAFLKRLVTKGYTPGKLAEPFRGHYQNPALTIIPPISAPDLAALVTVCERLVPELTRIWHAEGATILQQLTQANLSQTSYKPTQIGAATSGLERWLAAGDGTAPCPGLKLFTSSAVLAGQKKGSTLPSHPFFSICQHLHDTLQLIEAAFTEGLIECQTRLHHWIRRELAERKRNLNLRCYDDLLLNLQQALTGERGGQLAHNLRQRYHAALIDEFQDTDPLQWQIFSCMAGLNTKSISRVDQGGEEEATQAYMTIRQEASDEVNAEIRSKATSYPLFLIGDPKQAIYSFRGADIYAYLAAGRSVEEQQRATLITNRRSVAPLVSAVNTLFEASADPFLCTDISFIPVAAGRDPGHQLLQDGQPLEHPLQFWVYPRSDQSQAVKKNEASRTIVRTVAEEIARLLDGKHEIDDKRGRRKMSPGDIAVLVKTHYQADLVQTALNALAIPSVQHGSATIFESDEAHDMLRILRAVHEPARERLVREALLTGSMGASANQIAEYLAAGDAGSQWETWLRHFRNLHNVAQTGGVIAMSELLLGQCGLRQRNLARLGGERILTNILQCVELLHQAEQEHARGLEALILWLERRITADEADDTALLRLETDENAVQLSTIHASKGLEYPVVFLPFAWDAPSAKATQVLFHDADGGLTLDLGSPQRDEHKELTKQERAAEAARLLYVAITRAEFLCYIAWGCISDANVSPLFQLLHGSTVADAKGFTSYPDKNILADINGHSAQAEGLTATFMPIDARAATYQPTGDCAPQPVCRTLTQAICNDWRVTSFSGMVARSEFNHPARDYDALFSAPSEFQPDERSHDPHGRTIFDFPRGSAAGTCLHEIFERLDYAALTSSKITLCSRTGLLAHGYDEQWLPAVSAMVATVTHAPLLREAPDFTLAQLSKGAWHAEMEFYLPLAQLSPEKLRTLFDGLLNPSLHANFTKTLESLNFRQSHGMLHGFMDLVFSHAGRYYIVDWKSNHLGLTGQKYSATEMSRSMAEHAYILQYHLYALALDRHLQQRLPGYSYDSHFGGVIYVYLRGVTIGSHDLGLFRDRPSAAFIRRANELLLG